MREDNILGLVFAVMANVAFVLNSGLLHVANASLAPQLNLLLVGNFAKWTLSHALLKYKRLSYDFPQHISAHDARAKQMLLIFLCQLLNTPSYYIFMIALQYIPIGTAMVVENLAPFIVAALSYVTIREKTSVTELTNMLVCFAVLCVTILQQDSNGGTGALYETLLGVGLTLLSLVMFSGTYVINRYLRETSSIVVNAQNALFSFVIGALMFVSLNAMSDARTNAWTFDAQTVLLGVINGVLSFGCGFMFIVASQLQPASRIAALDFSQVPMGYVLDAAVFGVHVQLSEVLGCLVICGCGAFVFWTARDAIKSQQSIISDTADLEAPLISQSYEDACEQFSVSIKKIRHRSENIASTGCL